MRPPVRTHCVCPTAPLSQEELCWLSSPFIKEFYAASSRTHCLWDRMAFRLAVELVGLQKKHGATVARCRLRGGGGKGFAYRKARTGRRPQADYAGSKGLSQNSIFQNSR